MDDKLVVVILCHRAGETGMITSSCKLLHCTQLLFNAKKTNDLLPFEI